MRILNIFTFVFLMSLFAQPAHAGQWTSVSEGDLQTARSFFEDSGTYYLTGNTGKSLYSADGQTWQQGQTGSSDFYFDHGKLADGNIVIVGNSGAVQSSVDSGLTWQSMSFGITDNINSIELNGDTGFITADNGTLYHYISAYGTWVVKDIGISQNLYDSTTKDDGTGFIVGQDGKMYYTTNKGNTWASATTGTLEVLHGITFLDNSTGFTVGTKGTVLKTTDGGITWASVAIEGVLDQQLYSIESSGNSIAIGGEKILITSSDSGGTWTVTDYGSTNYTFYNVYFDSGATLWAAGSDFGVSSLVYKHTLAGPSAPGNIQVSETLPTEKTTLTFNWDASVIGDAEISTYYVKVNEGEYVDVGNVTSYEVTEVVGEHAFSVYSKDTNEKTSDFTSINFEIVEPQPEVVEEVPEAEKGDLIKIECSGETEVNDPCRAVYYYGADGARHAFPNEKVFFGWYSNFDDVVEVTPDFMSSVVFGKNVTYKSGEKMVKFQSVKTVYAVEKGGVLRAIASEQVAIDLYGVEWNKNIDDISDIFYGNYTFGEEIDESSDYSVENSQNSTLTIDDNF